MLTPLHNHLLQAADYINYSIIYYYNIHLDVL